MVDVTDGSEYNFLEATAILTIKQKPPTVNDIYKNAMKLQNYRIILYNLLYVLLYIILILLHTKERLNLLQRKFCRYFQKYKQILNSTKYIETF